MCFRNLRILAAKNDNPCAAPMLFLVFNSTTSSCSLLLVASQLFSYVFHQHDSCSTNRRFWVFCLYNKQDWYIQLGSLPSQPEYPKNSFKYLEKPMSCSRLLLLSVFFFLASEGDWDAQDTQCLIGLQDLRLQKVFSGQTLAPFLSLLPWAFCLFQIVLEYFPPFCTWQLGWTHCSVIALWFMLHFLLQD